MPTAPRDADRSGKSSLVRVGMASWSLLGIIALAVVSLAALGAVSGIVIPLVIAVIVGVLLEPVTRWLRSRGVPPPLAVTLTLLLVAVVGGGIVYLLGLGLIRQLPEIGDQAAAGWDDAVDWVKTLDIDPEILDQGYDYVTDVAPDLGLGALGLVASFVAGAASVVMGTIFAVFFLFFVLKDHDLFLVTLARVTRLDDALVTSIDGIVQRSLRGYFRGVAVTALVTAPVFMIPLLLFRVPLALPIFILYFLLSFIPFIGAWITAAFAVLIAFGSGGPMVALIIALALLVSNGTIQNFVSSWALGSSLRMHPVAVVLATLIGGTIAGLLGMVLGPPLLAVTTRTVGAVRQYREDAASSTDLAGAVDAPDAAG